MQFLFSNGTAALHGACFAAGISEGDEVITTPMTFAASANCVRYCGGTVVLLILSLILIILINLRLNPY